MGKIFSLVNEISVTELATLVDHANISCKEALNFHYNVIIIGLCNKLMLDWPNLA